MARLVFRADLHEASSTDKKSIGHIGNGDIRLYMALRPGQGERDTGSTDRHDYRTCRPDDSSLRNEILAKDYEKKLRERMWLFDTKTKNKKPLVHTFVTTFGLGEGKHHSIVHSEVTMDDLFNS